MKIENVALIGAGAVGSYLIWGLWDKLSDNFCVVADGKRRDRLIKEGRTINGRHFPLNVKRPWEAKGADLVFLTVKYNGLKAALDDLHQVCDRHTIIVSLMNGVDSEREIAAREDPGQVLPAFIKIASHTGRDGGYEFDPPTGGLGIYFGEEDGRMDSDRIAALKDLFAGTPLCYHVSENIWTDIWTKFTLNVSENLSQAIIGCGIGAFRDSEHVDALRILLRDEVITLAEKKGIRIPDTAADGTKFLGDKTLRYSTLQDLDAGRATEVDMLAGAMVRMGEECGVPVPCSTFAWHAIKALEEKNEGLFDYENRNDHGWVDGRSYKG